MIKNSEDFGKETANDPLGAQTLACFFSKSGQQIRKREGIKFEAKIIEDGDVESEDDNLKVKQINSLSIKLF